MSNPILIDDKTKSLIKAVPYFQTLDDTALRDVAENLIIRRYKAGDLIFLEGESDAGLQIVVEGLCKVYRLSEGGREHVLAAIKPGDSCNEVPVLDGGPNPANFAALEDSTVWVISTEALYRLRQKYPTLNDMIIKNLAMRSRQLVQRVYNLSFLSVTGRLADFLLQQDEEKNEMDPHHWTQDEIAAQLGTVREMVTRSFRELQQANLIQVDQHRVEILDRRGLEELV